MITIPRITSTIGIVSTLKGWIGKWKDAGDRSAARAQNPSGGQMRENVGPWNRKNRKKLLNDVRPCRNISVHIDLPVLILNPIKTSVGRYVFVQNSWPIND